MRSSASLALLFMLTFVFLHGEAKAQSAGETDRWEMTSQAAAIEDVQEDALDNSSWLDTTLADVGMAGATTADAADTDWYAEIDMRDAPDVSPSANLNKIVVADETDPGSAAALRETALRATPEQVPPVDTSFMRLAANTMAVDFKARDRAALNVTPSVVVRAPTALSLLTISLIVFTLFEHRRRQP